MCEKRRYRRAMGVLVRRATSNLRRAGDMRRYRRSTRRTAEQQKQHFVRIRLVPPSVLEQRVLRKVAGAVVVHQSFAVRIGTK